MIMQRLSEDISIIIFLFIFLNYFFLLYKPVCLFLLFVDRIALLEKGLFVHRKQQSY